ncbi:hypothetical protein N8135_03580 [Oceanospirillaceae bacterium]|nr:hypothetical protein [Oceanospirillaceae bacterium]
MMATVLFVMIWLLPVAVDEFRNNKRLLLAYWFVIALHQVVAFINAFWFTTLGAATDAVAFHKAGARLAQTDSFIFEFGSKFYELILGFTYWLFGTSLLLGQQLSVLAFALSCIVLIKILCLLMLRSYSVPILLVFGALPTMVLLGSITLRESYQILFFMLAFFFGLKMHLKGGFNYHFILLLLSIFVMGLFHKGLILYMLIFIFIFMVFSLKPTSHILRVKKLHLLLLVTFPLVLVVLLVVTKLQINGLNILTELVDFDILEYTEKYRRNSSGSDARATYGIYFNLSSFSSFISSSFIIYFYYLFAPFPWEIGNVLDIYASMESVMRMVLLYYAVKKWRNISGVESRLTGLMLILFFSMSLLWAMGTTNFGTAMRHHMLTWWILVVMGLPPLIDAARIRFASISKRR